MTKNIAFIFPGQGSQSVGMLNALAQKYTQVEETFAQASQVLGYDLWHLCQTGSEEALNQTQHTQPALLTAGVAVWRVWQQQQGAQPQLLAGHSLGEYTALVCAQALEFAHAVELVAKRGSLMQQAVPQGQGAMAAIIGLDNAQIENVCEQVSQGDNDVVTPANYNSHGQVVVAGHTAAVDRAIVAAKEAGAKIAKMIPVSVPSHCGLMREAAVELAKYLQTIAIQTPQIPVINNVNATIATHPDDIRENLDKQLYHPVRWVETIENMRNDGVELAIECGPGKVLTSLNKRIDRQLTALAVNDPASLQQALQACAQSVGTV